MSYDWFNGRDRLLQSVLTVWNNIQNLQLIVSKVQPTNLNFKYFAKRFQCRHSSLDLSTSALSFVKHHPLLHDMVDPAYGRPLYFTKDDLALTRLAVHTVGDHKVFFLGSSKSSITHNCFWST